MSKELELFRNIEKALAEKYELSVGAYENLIHIEKSLKALEIIKSNFRMVGNCLHIKNKYAENGWDCAKELEDDEEYDAWKEVLKDE